MHTVKIVKMSSAKISFFLFYDIHTFDATSKKTISNTTQQKINAIISAEACRGFYAMQNLHYVFAFQVRAS